MPEPISCRVGPFFVLRSPALPLGTLFGEGAAEAPGLSAKLSALAGRKAIQEALALASPDLAARLDLWRAGGLAAEDAARVEGALLRYLIRMCSRPTPFGLFAAVSMGVWAPVSHLELEAWQACRKTVRLDWSVLEALVHGLERRAEVRARCRLHPNSSLQRWGSWYRYLELRTATNGTGVTYHLESVEGTSHLDAALAGAGEGLPLGDLADRLAASEGVNRQEAFDFLDQLLDAQVLRSDLHPPLTADDPLGWVVRAAGQGPATSALEQVRAQLGALEAAALGDHPEGYPLPDALLADLGCPADARDRLHVNLYRPAPSLALGPNVEQALAEGADLLRRLTPRPRDRPLEGFRSAFLERYGQRWMPLLQVLDEESGLGFDGSTPVDAPLLEGLPLDTIPAEVPLTPRERFLLSRVGGWQGADPWQLDDGDLTQLLQPEPLPFPGSFAALACLSAPDQAALDRGDFTFWMEGYTGPTAARYLGRFASGDARLAKALRELLDREAAHRPEAIFAEVVHPPEGRAGNVVARPALRPHEIPLLGASGVPEDQQILPADLLVTVQGERVRLASRRLGREVIPRLSTAHNHARGPAVYRFLAQLQEQEEVPGGWSWGALSALPFLPRVCHGRQVICRARWRVLASELASAHSQAGTDPQAVMSLLRKVRGLPRWVVLADADNTLMVDLEEPLMVEMLFRLVARRAAFTLVECYPALGQSPVQGPEGMFTHELVVPFESPGLSRASDTAPVVLMETGDPVFAPGTEWLYLKLYCGPATADRLLLELEPLLRTTHREGLWDRWHFLRYRDPGHHLRVRFHGPPEALLSGLLPRLRDHLAAPLGERLLQRWQVDTFEPELARYGGHTGFRLAEAWFDEDSWAVLDALAADAAPDTRWIGGLTTVDALWRELGLRVPERLELARRSRDAFRREFRDLGPVATIIGRRFRDLRRLMPPIGPEPASRVPHGPGRLAELRSALERGELQASRDNLAGSLAHMHLNRRFRDRPREQEWVLMEFLARLYEGHLARRGRMP